jgi:ABC-type sulfate/molybdate transport systems ATPase subunit
MPQKARKSRQELLEQEGRIECTINNLKNGRIHKIEEAIQIYNLPPTTLHAQLNGHASQVKLRNQNHRLSLLQEEALIAWIVSLDIHGVPPRPFQVREMAQIILDAETNSIFTCWKELGYGVHQEVSGG